MCRPLGWAHVNPLLLQPPCPRAWPSPSRHLLLEAPVRSYRKPLRERALLLPWGWRGNGGAQRPSRPVAAVGIVDPPRLVGARRPARREWPGRPAAASLGWSRRKSAACAGWVSRRKGSASKGGQVGEAYDTNAGTLAGGNGGASGGAQEVEALSQDGSWG
jgi:hypothetical protein